MAVATPSEIQTILRTEKDYGFISDMIPIVQDTIDRYFNTSFSGSYPVSLKRPAAILIQQMLENPAASIVKKIGDDESRYGKIDLSIVFSGLDNLIVGGSTSAKAINLTTINDDLGL